MYTLGLELREALLGVAIEGTGGIRYHVRELLGEGGQGWVYKANYDDPDGFWIVVKVLRPDGVQSEALKRFEREAEVLRMLGAVATPNPSIVRFYDHGVHTMTAHGGEISLPFIALEHVDGSTLAKVIRAQGGFGLPVGRVRRIMKQVARALATVHDKRIVHRDLKPSNILLTEIQGQEVAKVTDFGLVKLPELSAHRTATVAGASLGYAPPEQYEMGNNRVTVQTDVFSFATILHEALCGTEAFPAKSGDNPLRIVARMLSADRPSLEHVSATVPRELRERPELLAGLDRELARATSADPAARHASIRELWGRVEPFLNEALGRGAGRPLEDPSSFDGGAISLVPAETPAPAAVSLGATGQASLRIAARPISGDRLSACALASDGRSVLALGSHGVYQLARKAWTPMHLPRDVDARRVRGMARLPSGAMLFFGEGGFALELSPGGVAERVDVGERDATLLGVHADAEGLVFVGERASRPAGLAIELARGGARRKHVVEARLHAATRLGSGSVAACGARGLLVELWQSEAREIRWGRTGHLYALAAAADGGAYAVGSGGHALRIAPAGAGLAPAVTLEGVQTTRDLTAVAVDASGCAWAAGESARLLRRSEGKWLRVALDPSVDGRLVGIAVRADSILVVCEDGTVLEADAAR